MLLQIFAACPAPASPQWTMRLPIFSRIGRAAANASAAPSHMKVKLAALAPPTPPETGASIESNPAPFANACARRALSTSIVEESINSEPCFAAPTISLQTATTGFPAGNIVIATSARDTASTALAAMATPSLAAESRKAATTSKPSTSCPALTRLAAIGPPMLPRPMNAMVVMNVSCVLSFSRPCGRRWREAPDEGSLAKRPSPQPSPAKSGRGGLTPPDHLARDDHAHDFVGPFEDLVDAQIAH